jgi:hypothetical protein
MHAQSPIPALSSKSKANTKDMMWHGSLFRTMVGSVFRVAQKAAIVSIFLRSASLSSPQASCSSQLSFAIKVTQAKEEERDSLLWRSRSPNVKQEERHFVPISPTLARAPRRRAAQDHHRWTLVATGVRLSEAKDPDRGHGHKQQPGQIAFGSLLFSGKPPIMTLGCDVAACDFPRFPNDGCLT